MKAFLFYKLAHTAEKRLQEDLIRNYNRLVRPVTKNSDILVVHLGIKLTQILDVVITKS
jgi:hypothetical protein